MRLKIIAPPENPPRDLTELGGGQPLSGALVANMSPLLAQEVGMDGFQPGLYLEGAAWFNRASGRVRARR